jgi:Flp pilus assembly pilin Flp
MTSARFRFRPPNDERGATAAEFAMVLPLLILFLFGIIDVGRFLWTWNQAEKATQMGVRMAVVTDMVPGGLYAADFSGSLGQGVPVPVTSFPGAICKFNGTLSCAPPTGTSCSNPCSLGTANLTAFNRVVARMKRFLPAVTASKVQIEYTNSGLGYAGDPNGPDIAPFVTVRLKGIEFQPILLSLFGGSITFSDRLATLTMEDGAGNVSN